MHNIGKKRRERFALNPDKEVKCNIAVLPIYPVQQAAVFGPAKWKQQQNVPVYIGAPLNLFWRLFAQL